VTRAEVLVLAAKAVLKDRATNYGPPEKSFDTIASFWNAWLVARHGLLDHVIEPFDVAVMLTLLKVARIANNPEHLDNWVDIAGYAACGAEVVNGRPE
jgi:hypothetical protein